MSGLTFQGGLSSSARYVEIKWPAAGPGDQLFDFQNLPGGETVVGRVIPEPSLPLLAGGAGLALLGIRRRSAA